MRDLAPPPPGRPLGWFVHHQGRGHATRTAALVNALPPDLPVTIFCARDDIFPPLRENARIRRIASLFEPRGTEPAGAAALETPETLHCAPVGWSGIREATGEIAAWFRDADPLLFVSDVSAEMAQLARLCSVPHVAVLQHGDRDDAGHRAAYDGAAGLLAPFHADLAQPDWPAAMRAKTHFAPGLGQPAPIPSRAEARRALGIAPGARVALVLSGAGGGGISSAPLGIAARSFPDWRWLSIGPVGRDWHATEPANLAHLGWVADPERHIAAADLVIGSAGNTVCQQVLAAGRPWIVVPEWRYFDEQVRKAEALARAGVALHLAHPPSSAGAWRDAVRRALATQDPARQRRLVAPDPAGTAARWLTDLARRLWAEPVDDPERTVPCPTPPS